MTEPFPALHEAAEKKANFFSFLFDKTKSLLDKVFDKISKAFHKSSCDLPPPCWAPRALEPVLSCVKRGEAATIRLRITNAGIASRTINIDVAGKPEDVAKVTITPASLTLGSMERDWVEAVFTVPADAEKWSSREVLVWVRGCHKHYARWTIGVDLLGAPKIHELFVEDAPDLVHHWSDHFYCDHGCPGGH